MKAVILAGGLGTRLRPLTEVVPKPLLPVGEKPVLEIQIERLKRYGATDVYIATNYKSEDIESFVGDGSKYGLRIHLSKEDKPLGTCGPLTLIKDQLDEPFVMMNGDILTTMDFGQLRDFGGTVDSDLVVATHKLITPFHFGNVESVDGYITNVNEKPDLEFEILAGIYLMKPGIFSHIPEDTYFGIDMLIKNMLSSNVKVAKYLIEGLWLDIGSMSDYQKAQEVYKEHFDDAS